MAYDHNNKEKEYPGENDRRSQRGKIEIVLGEGERGFMDSSGVTWVPLSALEVYKEEKNYRPSN